MASSKEPDLTVPDEPWRPKCARCRHHGLVVPQKGHAKRCPFLRCSCWRCCLVAERTRIAALRRDMRKAEKEGRSSGVSGATPAPPPPTATPGAAAPQGGARPPPAAAPVGPAAGWTSGGDAGTDSPLDLRTRTEPHGSARELTTFNPDYCGELWQSGPLSAVNVPCGGPAHYGGSFPPCPPNPLFSVPYFPLMPPSDGFSESGHHRGLMLPCVLPDAVLYPPPPGPRHPADCRWLFVAFHPNTLPEFFQQRPWPPLPEPHEQDVDVRH